MVSPYVFEYRGTFRFADLERRYLWEKLAQRERYEQWWPWMRDLEARGDGLEPGSGFDFLVVSPLPYRMRLRVRITDSKQPEWVDAEIEGHLEGTASVELIDGSDGTTTVVVAWTVEVKDRAMRMGARVARPLIRWGQDWAVRVALRNFRAHLVAATGSRREPEV